MNFGVIEPSFSEFKKLAAKGNMIPLCINVLADQITPVALLSSKWGESSHCFLLESVEGGEKLGRYSIVSFGAEAILEENRGRCELRSPGGHVTARTDENILDALHRLMRPVKPVVQPGTPRFFGGAVGYCSYETVHDLERLPKTKPDELGWPRAAFLITRDMFVFDNTQQVIKVLTCVRLDKRSDLSRLYREAVSRLRKNVAMLSDVRPQVRPFQKRPAGRKVAYGTNMSKAKFMEAVKKAKAHIGKGDIIQVVLSRRSEKKTSAGPLDIYRALRVINPSPYMYVIKMNERAIIGSSPEPLVRLEQGMAMTRPIAGTRRRGDTPEKDNRLRQELIHDPKEIAEHVMLVDLGRNDLGRVCDFGTVRVPTFMVVEKYSHVMHLVSEVTGRLQKGKDSFDLLKAAFPAGTVSGAPKIRAMEIIDDLELSQRGPYAGAIGYFSYSGNMDMAITIRTMLWDNGRVSIQTGAGIVADSDPAREFQETENKAAAMKETLRLAESGRFV